MSRHEVTGDSRTFQQIYVSYAARGIDIDHFHIIDASGDVNHIEPDYCMDEHGNTMKDEEGNFLLTFNTEVTREIGNSPSNCWVTPGNYAVKVIADEWHGQ